MANDNEEQPHNGTTYPLDCYFLCCSCDNSLLFEVSRGFSDPKSGVCQPRCRSHSSASVDGVSAGLGRSGLVCLAMVSHLVPSAFSVTAMGESFLSAYHHSPPLCCPRKGRSVLAIRDRASSAPAPSALQSASTTPPRPRQPKPHRPLTQRHSCL